MEKEGGNLLHEDRDLLPVKRFLDLFDGLLYGRQA
jgi:hypothetical protein